MVRFFMLDLCCSAFHQIWTSRASHSYKRCRRLLRLGHQARPPARVSVPGESGLSPQSELSALASQARQSWSWSWWLALTGKSRSIGVMAEPQATASLEYRPGMLHSSPGHRNGASGLARARLIELDSEVDNQMTEILEGARMWDGMVASLRMMMAPGRARFIPISVGQTWTQNLKVLDALIHCILTYTLISISN